MSKIFFEFGLKKKSGLLALISLIYSGFVFADCECGSSDADSPCTGQSITVNIKGDKGVDYADASLSWSFNSGGGDARCGQFANGDYWVAPAPGQSSVTVSNVTDTLPGGVYLDENPTPEAVGFLNHDYGNFSASENILGALPMTFSAATSLVAAVENARGGSSAQCGTSGVAACVELYSVLTVLGSVPQNAGSDVFRPSITRANKELLSWDDFDLSRLPSKNFFDAASSDELEEIRQRWAHHSEVFSLGDKTQKTYSKGGSAFRANWVTSYHGSEVAQQFYTGLSMLMSSESIESTSKPALASMLTYGKDIYSAIYTSEGTQERYFNAGGVFWVGRYPAAVFFAAMAKGDTYGEHLKSISQTNIGNEKGVVNVAELDVIIDGPNGAVWGGGNFFSESSMDKYWNYLFSGKQYAGATSPDPGGFHVDVDRDPHGYIDGPGYLPLNAYGVTYSGTLRGFAAQMLLMPGVCEIVNYDPLVEFAIRLSETGLKVEGDPCAPPDPRENENCNPKSRSGWGPRAEDPSQCIVNGLDPLSGEPQQGRFGHLAEQESSLKFYYRTLQIEGNWDAIVDGRVSTCKSNSPPLPPANFRRVL